MSVAPDFAHVIAQAPDGVLVVDRDGSIVYANARIEHLFGFEPDELQGGPVERLIPERFQQGHRRHRGSYAERPRVRPMGAAHLAFLGRHKNGSEFPVEIHLAPLHHEDQQWTLAFIRDATEKHLVHEELKRSRQAAQDLARVKGEFLSLAAHDLSQPVQTLELVCSAIERLAPPASEFAELALQASTSLARMRELLGMLLDIARMESGSIQIDEQPVRVQDIAEDLERRFAPAARAKSLTLRISPCPRIIVTDPKLLRGMLSNLLSNAIRYTRRGEVHIDCSLGVDGGVSLAVHDTGLGIAPEQVQAIFKDFYRTREAKEVTSEGFGLGLGIVRRLSRVLGLEVSVQSVLGKGSTFTVHIPSTKVFPLPDQKDLS